MNPDNTERKQLTNKRDQIIAERRMNRNAQSSARQKVEDLKRSHDLAVSERDDFIYKYADPRLRPEDYDSRRLDLERQCQARAREIQEAEGELDRLIEKGAATDGPLAAVEEQIEIVTEVERQKDAYATVQNAEKELEQRRAETQKIETELDDLRSKLKTVDGACEEKRAYINKMRSRINKQTRDLALAGKPIAVDQSELVSEEKGLELSESAKKILSSEISAQEKALAEAQTAERQAELKDLTRQRLAWRQNYNKVIGAHLAPLYKDYEQINARESELTNSKTDRRELVFRPGDKGTVLAVVPRHLLETKVEVEA